ncbi:LysR family transcriptional regulator [Vibrio sp. FNV 38]|nr:LysR family transcriptional regulator [Vibrio sp. FNV 38]
MDDIANHRALICVSKTGSFSVAAARLGISKVMISRAIKTLETELGFRLLDRNARGSKLTAKGKAYVDLCRPTIRSIETCVQSLSSYKREFKRQGSDQSITLRLSSPNTFGSIVLSQVISDFHHVHPNYLVELVTDEAFQNIFEHKLDISIRAHLTSDSIHENTISRPLIRLPFLLCCTPEYLKDVGQPENVEALFEQHAFVAWTHLNQHQRVTLDAAGQHVFTPQSITFMSNNSLACERCILLSKGIGFLPYHVIRTSLQSGALVPLFAEHCSYDVDLRMTYLNPQGTQSATATFVDYLTSSDSIIELQNEIEDLKNRKK